MKRENILRQKVITYIEIIIRYFLKLDKDVKEKNVHVALHHQRLEPWRERAAPRLSILLTISALDQLYKF